MKGSGKSQGWIEDLFEMNGVFNNIVRVQEFLFPSKSGSYNNHIIFLPMIFGLR